MCSPQDLQALQDHFSSITDLDVKLDDGSTYLSSTRASSLDEKHNDKPSSTKLEWRFYASFGCLCLVNLVCAIDATILSVALPTITKKLHGTSIQAFWAGTSYLLASTVLQPPWTSFSHILGRKPVLMAALAFFTTGSIIAATTHNITGLLVGRCIQGIGGGGIVALTYVITTDMVSLQERGKWFGLISLQWAIGSVTGPILGGAIVQEITWRWIFWLNLPFCGIALVAIPICLRLDHKVDPIFEKLRVFDWIGSLIFVASMTSFLVPLTWGGVMYRWGHWKTLVPLILGSIGLICFAIHSKYIALEPLIRGSIFSNTTANSTYIATTIHGMILWSILYYMPLYYEVVKGYGPITAGISLFPFTFTIGPSAIVIGLIITRTGRYRPSIWFGWFLATLGLILLLYLEESTTPPQWIGLSLVSGLGCGILYPAMSIAVQASATITDLPFAAAMFSFFRSLGQTFGIAIGGMIFQNTFKQKLATSGIDLLRLHADEWAMDAGTLVGVVNSMMGRGQEHVRMQLIGIYVDSLRVIWIVMCALAAISLLGSLAFTKEISLKRDHKR